MYSSSHRLTCWVCFSLALHCRRFLVEENLSLHTSLYLCANPGPMISQLVAVETAVLFGDKAFERGVALKSIWCYISRISQQKIYPILWKLLQNGMCFFLLSFPQGVRCSLKVFNCGLLYKWKCEKRNGFIKQAMWEGTFMSLKEGAKLSITSNRKRITRSEFK